MKWNDFKKLERETQIYGREKTQIECPNCGQFIHRRLDLILTSNPPQYQYECPNCGWVGYSFITENTIS